MKTPAAILFILSILGLVIWGIFRGGKGSSTPND